MDDPTAIALRQAFERYSGALRDLIRDIEQSVVTSRCATHAMVGWEPHFAQVDRTIHPWGAARREWLDTPEPGSVLHGMDEDGRVRVMRATGADVYIAYGEAHVDCIHTRLPSDGGPELQLLRRFSMSGERAETLHVLDAGSLWETRYEWRDQRCTGATVHKVLEPHGDTPCRYYGGRTEETYVLDEAGDLRTSILRTYNRLGECTGHDVSFVLTDGLNAPALSGEIEETLVESIPAAAQRAAISDSCRALLVGYCGEDLFDTYPGLFLVFVPAALAAQLMKEDQSDFVWEPDELRDADGITEIHIHDPRFFDVKLLEKCDALKRLLSVDGVPGDEGANANALFDALVAPLRSAVRRLNLLDWSRIMPVTGDFFVLARDNTGAVELEEDSRKSVPKERWNRLGLGL